MCLPQQKHLKMHCSNLIGAVLGMADCTPQPPTTAVLGGDRVQQVQEPLLAQAGHQVHCKHVERHRVHSRLVGSWKHH